MRYIARMLILMSCALQLSSCAVGTLASEGWKRGQSISYKPCGPGPQPAVVHVGSPPVEVLGDDEDAVPLLKDLTPSPADACVERIERPALGDRIAVWHFNYPASNAHEALLVVNGDVMVPLDLPDRRRVLESVLTWANAWPSSPLEAVEAVRLGQSLTSRCGEKVLEDFGAYRKRLRQCLGSLPFPEEWARRLENRLPIDLTPRGREAEGEITVDLWTADTWGSVHHAQWSFTSEHKLWIESESAMAPTSPP